MFVIVMTLSLAHHLSSMFFPVSVDLRPCVCSGAAPLAFSGVERGQPMRVVFENLLWPSGQATFCQVSL